MSERRQVVLIMTDTQGANMVGCYGETGLKTPCIDRLASQGVRFERAYTCSPVSGPARSGIFTGNWPHTNGSWSNLTPLGLNFKTVGKRLSDAGVRTCYVGKWHLDGTDYFGNGRCPPGWDDEYWYDMRRYLEELPEADRARSRRPETSHADDMTAEFTYAHRVSDRARRFLAEHGSEDLLLVVSYDEPHGPFLCPPPYCDMYADYEYPKKENCFDTLEGKPLLQRLWAEDSARDPAEPFRHPLYFGCNSFVDSEIGRVVEAVDEHAPGALLVFTSDHGDMLGAHRIVNKGPVAYDEIARIPFIVRWPGESPEGEVCAHPVSQIDLTPSVLEAMGLERAPFLEGRSMLRTFRDPSVRPNDAVFIEFGRYEVDHDGFGGFQPMRAVFDGRHKLVVNLLDTDELYDLDADPGEMTNLIAESSRAELRDRLHDRLLAWMNETRDPFRGYQWACRPWRQEKRPSWANDGMTRQRDDDGYEPRMLDYATGLEMTEATRKK